MTENDQPEPGDPGYNRAMAIALHAMHLAYDRGDLDPVQEAELNRDAPTWRSKNARLAVSITMMLPVAPVDEAPVL